MSVKSLVGNAFAMIEVIGWVYEPVAQRILTRITETTVLRNKPQIISEGEVTFNGMNK